MEIFDLTHWQYYIAAAIVAVAIYTSMKNKAVYGKLACMIGMTLIVGLQLFKVPAAKETALDSRIRLEAQQMTGYVGRPGVPADLEGIMAGLTKLNVADKTRNDAAQVEPLLAKLTGLTFPAPYMKEQAAQLAASWKNRIENTPAMLEKELAALESKASLTPEEQEKASRIRSMLPSWYDKLPLKLGLDLRGGTEVRLRLLPEREKLDNYQRQLVALEKDPAKNQAAIADLTKKIEEEKSNIQDNFRNASDVIRSRLNSSGLEEISVSTQGGDKLLIQMPGMSSAAAQGIINRLKKLGQLEFRLTVADKGENANTELLAAVAKAGGETDRRNYSRREGRFLGDEEVIIRDGVKTDIHGETLVDWLHDDEGRGNVVEQEIRMTGEYLSGARAMPSQQNPGSFEIAFWLTPKGSLLFGSLTSQNIGRQLAIVLDGKLKSAPTIQSTITTNGTITGNFTRQDAQDLEVVLKSGSLKTRVEVDFENTVGPTLGEDSIRAGMHSMLIGSLLVVLFMMIYYRAGGVVSDIALFSNVLMIAALLSGMNATLTLPGIAGLVLTVGMAVDANVLVFERIREEREKGNVLTRAIQLGYERAFVTIIDANVTTFIIALILHQFGTESVKGFAITLIIGIITSVFTSLVFTRWMLDAMVEWGWLKEMKMLRFFARPNFQFVKVRRLAMLGSLILIVLGMAVFVGRGQKNLSQDFTGGLFAQIALTEDMTMAQARQKIEPLYADFTDLTIQSYGQEKAGKFREFILRTAEIKPADQDMVAKDSKAKKTALELRAELEKIFPLQKDGLQVSGARLKDKSTPDKAVFEVRISMETPRKTADVVEMLSRNTVLENITPVTLADKVGTDVVVTGQLPVVGQDGKQRDDNELSSMVRDQVQRLRYQGLLDFTEPFPRFVNIGATVAGEMIQQAILALIFSLAAIFVYIWLRFKFNVAFGTGAVLALAHDVFMTLGALAVADELGLLNGQISLTVVAALLTLVGYSINDTIVVFDRIRENMHLVGKSLEDQVDLAVNQTLSRTIITSMTVWIVVVILLIFGGEVIRAFSFALCFGVIVGTYSSIFIAAPILIEFSQWAKKRMTEKAKQQLAAAQAPAIPAASVAPVAAPESAAQNPTNPS